MEFDKRSQGVTLVELMFTLLVAAILIGVGVPSMTSVVNKIELQTVSKEIANTLQGARERAVSSGETVTVKMTNSGIECNYSIASTNYDCNQYPFTSSKISITPDTKTFTFDNSGRINSALQLKVEHSGISGQSFNVTVRPSGRVSLKQAKS